MELRGFWCRTEGCVELRGFLCETEGCLELRDFEAENIGMKMRYLLKRVSSEKWYLLLYKKLLQIIMNFCLMT